MGYFTWYELMRRQQNPEVPTVAPTIVIGTISIGADHSLVAWDELTNTGWQPFLNSGGTGFTLVANPPEDTVPFAMGYQQGVASPQRIAVLQVESGAPIFMMTDAGAATDFLVEQMEVVFMFYPIPIV